MPMRLLVETVLDLTRGDLGALDAAGQRRRVDTDGHRDRGVVNRDARQRTRVVDVGEGLTDGDLLDTGDGDDVSGTRHLGGDALEALGLEQFGDLHGLGRAVGTRPRDLLALTQARR
ncbi:hypothetical protein GCM10025876_10910 [Demequina litorisediminis]|uniref:Uncharacterized protein n=1 Tax=Demequina litorisediminis TaxID=1849022 RepID=A0ABQ6IAK8_9MICO|nr:hypothetical protein GCM10025876_10910 [Demequina litorisediminis]